MNPKPRAFRPGTSCLEPRVLLSAAEISSSAFTKSLLAGTLQGRYQAGQDNRAADAPMRVVLNGNGTMQGKTKLIGALQFGGYRLANAPDINGTLTLSEAKGSLKLQIAGSGGQSEVPKKQFKLNAGVVSGTGAYANAQGVGTITFSFGPDHFRGKPTAGPATFALDLKAPVR